VVALGAGSIGAGGGLKSGHFAAMRWNHRGLAICQPIATSPCIAGTDLKFTNNDKGRRLACARRWPFMCRG
jgi:hypothetical protein